MPRWRKLTMAEVNSGKPKVGILVGGLGSRLAEETQIRPKPMVEIGSLPILWHIMMIYHGYRHDQFALALGYKGDFIKRWFIEHCSIYGSFKLNTCSGAREDISKLPANVIEAPLPDWDVSFLETGRDTATGGRIKRLLSWAGGERMMITWGDGVSNIDLDKLLEFHKSHGKLATLTAVRPPARYGHLEFEGQRVSQFTEKPQTGEGWINGAFFVLEPEVAEFISGDEEMFEHDPLSRLAEEGQLMAYHHDGFWQCMDTMREKKILQDLWDSGEAPWKIWN